jgi:predicted dithiol-disulfide oxidoreductase (DUF899 family)
MVEFDNDYAFEGADGAASLLDLFEGRRQLIVYHFMLAPGANPCVGCSAFVDNIGHLAHLHARDTSLALVSRAPIAQIESFKQRMGWSVPWFSSFGSDFDADCGITTGFGLSVFLRDGERVFRSYFTTARRRSAADRFQPARYDSARTPGGVGGLARRMAANDPVGVVAPPRRV